PDLLPRASLVTDVTAAADGYVADIEPMAVALTANRLGAGRARKGDPIDHAVGLEILRTVGDVVPAGEPVARVHARSDAQYQEALAARWAAFTTASARPEPRPIVLDRASTEQ